MSSFLQQYGIRLAYEYETISYEEFNQLLTGINTDTPFGYVVSVRAESDSKKISQMTNKEKEIRAKWREFRKGKEKDKKIYLDTKDISKFLGKLFN